MRRCIYCGMPMEDDDLFCTRCGKEVPKERAGKTPETSDDRVPGLDQKAGKPEMRSRRSSGAPAGAAAARGMSYDYDPREKHARDDYDLDDYDDEAVDEEYEEEERGGRFDRGTIIMLSAAAVLLLVLGVLLFNIMHIANSGKDSAKDDEIAVYNNENSQEQNLNQGQQTPASGPAEDNSEETPAADEDAYSDTQDSGQQTDPSAVEVPDTDTEAEEQQKKEEEERRKEEQRRAEEEKSQESQQETPDEDDEYYEDENTGEEDYAGEEDDEYGWTIDEDGNEVYYPEEGEEYEGDDQTGGVSQQSVPEKDKDAVSVSGGTRSKAGKAASGTSADAPEEDSASDDSEAAAPEEDTVSEASAADAPEEESVSDGSEAAALAGSGASDDTAANAPAQNRAGSGTEATALAGSGASTDSEYILPDSDSRLYTREELSGLDDNTLQLAINEIYARHGRKFNTESMQVYFDGKSWYSGTVEPEVFDGNEAAYFNEYEIKNRELLSTIRAERQEAAGTAAQQS